MITKIQNDDENDRQVRLAEWSAKILDGGPTNPMRGKGPNTIIAAVVAYHCLEVDDLGC